MLTNKELGELKRHFETLGIELGPEQDLETAGIAVVRFCLAKTLREANLLS